VSPSRTATSLPEASEEWRPMAFGFQEAKTIRDPVCEPLWAGRRVFAAVADGRVALRGEEGEPLEGFKGLREAISTSVYAGEALLDGYLLPAPLRATVGAEAPLGMDSTPTANEMSRQMVMGSGGVNRNKEKLRIAEERRVEVHPAEPTAFVAIDLLWLDGEPLIDVPLLERKRHLDSVVVDHELVRRTVIVRPPVEAWYGQWRALGFREFAVKSANSRYRPGTASDHWTTAFIPKR
jgi:hypothetical protein